MPLQEVAYVGDNIHADAHTVSYDSMLGNTIPKNFRPGVYAGTGAPTFSAPQGSIYINMTGNSTSTRLFVNTNSGTTWTAVTTAT